MTDVLNRLAYDLFQLLGLANVSNKGFPTVIITVPTDDDKYKLEATIKQSMNHITWGDNFSTHGVKFKIKSQGDWERFYK